MAAIMFLLISLCFATFILFMCLSFFTGAPFVPSGTRTSETMVTLAHIKKGMHVYDLGSGDGRLLFLSAKKGAAATGFEINPILVIFTKLRILFSPYRAQTHVYWKSFWRSDYRDADVVFVYLLPWKMEKLESLLMKNLRKGTRIISNSFIFPHLTKVSEDLVHHVFVFKT